MNQQKAPLHIEKDDVKDFQQNQLNSQTQNAIQHAVTQVNTRIGFLMSQRCVFESQESFTTHKIEVFDAIFCDIKPIL